MGKRLPRKLADLKPWDRNPREIDTASATGLGVSLTTFGDLSGITYNTRLDALVCGHQRVTELTAQGAKLLGSNGTLRIEAPNGETFRVRVVDWDVAKHAMANTVANSDALTGRFTPALGPILDELQTTLPDLSDGLRLGELRGALPPAIPADNKPIDEDDLSKTGNECPKCGFKW